MTFPTIAATANNTTSATTSHTVNLDASISSGDLLLVWFVVDGVETTTWPDASWLPLVDSIGAQHTTDVFYRDATGSEGSTITVTTGGSQNSSSLYWRIPAAAWHGTTPPEAASGTANNNSPDPPNLAPSWGAEDNLYIAGCGYNDGRTTVSGYSTNYTDNQTNIQDGAAGGVGVGVASRDLNATSDNPGTMSLSAAENHSAFTIAVRPAGGAPPPSLRLLALIGAG